MSLTDTARHWLRGWPLATAASRWDVNVAMPHLRGKWSPTKAILRTLEVLFNEGIPLLPWRPRRASINLILQVALQTGNGVDPSGFVAPGNNRCGKVSFLLPSA